MRVQGGGTPCERCGATLGRTATAQQLANHRASRMCVTGPERHRMRALGLRVVDADMGRWLNLLGVTLRHADTDPKILASGEAPVPQCWVPAWADVLVCRRGDVPRLILRAAVWRAVRFDALGEALLNMARLGGDEVVREFLLNDAVILRTAVDEGARLLAAHGWTDA